MTRERAKELLPVITAFAEGKDIEIRIDDHWDLVFETAWHRDAEYRIKPSPVLRPWKPEEVPVGAVVNRKGNGPYWVAIVGASSGCVQTGYTEVEYDKLLASYNHSTDGGKTWHPCGVVEDAS